MTPQRDPVLAGFLSVLLPGLGHLYAGHVWQALALFVLLSPLAIGTLLLVAVIPLAPFNVVIPLVLFSGLVVLGAWDAVRSARTYRGDGVGAIVSQWYFCLAAFVFFALLFNPLLLRAGTSVVVQAYRVTGTAMKDTLEYGDRTVVIKCAYGWRAPLVSARLTFGEREALRGDVVVFRYPKNRGVAFVQRIVGLPGETIESRKGRVLINGRALEEPYARPSDDDWGPLLVPPRSYFALGDNRNSSNDSRAWGFVPQEDLLGRVAVIFWSYEAGRVGRRVM